MVAYEGIAQLVSIKRERFCHCTYEIIFPLIGANLVSVEMDWVVLEKWLGVVMMAA